MKAAMTDQMETLSPGYRLLARQVSSSLAYCRRIRTIQLQNKFSTGTFNVFLRVFYVPFREGSSNYERGIRLSQQSARVERIERSVNKTVHPAIGRLLAVMFSNVPS
jgi:hypothetical protein